MQNHATKVGRFLNPGWTLAGLGGSGCLAAGFGLQREGMYMDEDKFLGLRSLYKSLLAV